MAIVYQFPPDGDPSSFQNDIPVWMYFYCADYSTFSQNRTRNHILGNANFELRIPYPQQHNTLNSQTYQTGGSLNVRAIETGNIGELIGAQISATADMAKSFFSGGGLLRFDHFESILSPGARRTHNFNINFVAKNTQEATVMNTIALAFQTNVFPIATNNFLTMKHPPLWYFKAVVVDQAIDFSIQSAWDGQPLPSVLTKVDINRSPILNTPFIGSDFRPVALNIKMSFIELEPALQSGGGLFNIISRSERLAGIGQAGFRNPGE
jgi:hypothetical protein